MKSYKIVEIEFHDHVVLKGNDLEKLTCMVWGVLIREDKHYYYIMHWATNKDPFNEDTEVYGIAKTTLLRPIRYLGLTTL
jgi:hypothetical protein